MQGHPAAEPTCPWDRTARPWGMHPRQGRGPPWGCGQGWGRAGITRHPRGQHWDGEVVGVLGEDFRNGGWGIIFPAAAATSGCGCPVLVPNPCPTLSPKGCSRKKSGKGRVGTQIPQPNNSELTHRGSRVPSLALSGGEAAQLGLGWFPALARGRAGCISKYFQHFLKGTAMSRAGQASLVHSEGCSAGWCRHCLSEYH